MSNDTENCPFCATVNSYKSTHCLSCHEELPWAGWVKAARGPSQALGAEVGHYIRPGDGQMEVSGGYSAGLRTKIMGLVMMLVLAIAILGIGLFAKNRLKTSNGNVVDQFKKANPALQADEEMHKVSR